MGLPLFIPPVESDVPAKPAPKCPADPSHTRSPIRRTERRRQLNETRERRLRMLDAIQAADYASSRQVRGALQPPPTTRSVSRPADVPRMSGRRSPHLENRRISELTQHLDLERRYIGRPTTELSRVFAVDAIGDDPPRHFNPEASGTQVPEWPSPPHHSLLDTSFAPSVPVDRPLMSGRSSWRRQSDRDNDETRYRHRSNRDRLRQLQSELRDLEARSFARTQASLHAQRLRHLDGLGDRDRSLSPEGDAAWDTLQSTLTPDPQPPSVGSSFASTVVSATTPQANGTDSVNTSITTPDEEIEPPCDPVMENSGSDGEDDVEDQPVEPSRQPTPHIRRTYADVVAEPPSRLSPDSADAIDHDRELLSGMHRIVRGLASRGDIPDEWWAQAGLSRSMSWEDAN
ncbi:hypothetical protein F4803DRAFT_56196 [Xylaria telfairii]|nr:hypothetical protein F4803DRAFT_56196 [Xylaria telfairii]